MANCLKTFRNKLFRCDCTLKSWGFVAGWLGVIWRAVVTIFLATLIAKLTEYDPLIYEIYFITTLSYIQISLVANMFFIVGIQKEKPYFLLPYIVIGGIEIFLGAFILLGGIWVLRVYRFRYLLVYFIPTMLVLIGLYFVLWIQSIRLFRNMEIEITRKKEDNIRLANLRQSYVNSIG